MIEKLYELIERSSIFCIFRKYLIFFNKINFSDSLMELRKCDILFVCHDVDRGINFLGKAYSPLLDSVREDFEKRGWSCVTLNHPWSKLFGSRAWGSPVSMNRSYLFSLIKDKLRGTFNAKKIRAKSESSIFVLYESVIKITKPRCIISIGAPGELCRAAKSLNVCCVELLHGMGYTFLPWGFDKRKPEELPNGVLSLDDVSTQTFSSLKPFGVNTIQIPHPFIKRFVNQNFRDSLPSEWKSSQSLSTGIYSKEILVIFQWAYAGDHGEYTQFRDILPNGLFPDALVHLIEVTGNKVFWRFRFHPLHIRLTKYKILFEFIEKFCEQHKNTEWRASTNMPLPAVLVTCAGAIAMSSMSAYDAAYMGVPSLMLCPTVQCGGVYDTWFADLEAAGYVTKAPMTQQAIREWLESVERMQPMAMGLEDEAAWERAVDWMLGEPSTSNVRRYLS